MHLKLKKDIPSSRHIPEYAAIYRMRDFWVDIRNGEHDDYLDDALKACMNEIYERKNLL